MFDIDAELEAAERIVQVAQAELTRCADEVAFAFGITVPYETEWSTHGRTAGWCMYPTSDRAASLLKFNARLAVQEGLRFKEVVAHEYAHAVTYWRYGRRVRPHGREWQNLMQILGYPGDRCHSFSTVSAAQSRRKGLL